MTTCDSCGQRGWTCDPSCDFTLLCAETFYDAQWRHQYEYTWPAAIPPRKHVHSRVVATRPPAAESSGTPIGRQLPR
jgi:hypothetical protein